MKALRWHGRGDVRLDEVPDAKAPAPGEVTVAVSWCGICGTDLEEYLDGPVVIPTEPHPLTGRMAPLIMGHEVAGRVAAVGDGVDGLREGDLVAVDGLIFCGECYWCRRHRVNLCGKMASIGLMADGGLAEKLTVQAATCLRVPEGVADDHAPLAEPVSVAVRTIRRSRLRVGERIVILGAGTIGLALVQVARVGGASEIAVVDPIPFRRDLAEKFGAVAVEPGDGLAERLAVGGVGADVVVDATGLSTQPGVAASLVRSGGRAVVVGLPPEPSTIDVLDLVLREVELIGSLSHIYDEDFRIAIDLIADSRVEVEPLITHRIGLDRVVEDGFGALTGPQRDTTLKVLVDPSRT